MIAITEDTTRITDETTYRRFEINTKRYRMTVTVSNGLRHDVRVLLKNASHNAWRGQGRLFWSFEDAISYYKTEELRGALSAIEEICKAKGIGPVQ